MAECGENYITCANSSESIESIFKRLISVDEEGNLSLNICGCDCEGGGGFIAVTYAELVALITANGLTAGSWYLLYDFATVHYFTDGAVATEDINTGETEVLLLLATDVDKVDSRAYSLDFPNDVVHYDWDAANWLADVSFSADGVNIVDGWKGVITYRWDTKQDNYTGYDLRNVKFRRWALAPAGWDNLTEYDKGYFVLYAVDGNVYVSLVAANVGNTPGTDPEWMLAVDMSTTTYWSWNSTDCNGILVDDEDYDDFYTWVDYTTALGNHVEPNQVVSDNHTRLNNLVWDNTGGTCYYNSIGQGGFLGTFVGEWSYNTIGNGFYSNTCGAGFQSNTVGADFQGNTVGADFGSNTVGANFGSNTVGTDFQGNTVGAYFNGNTVGTYFNGNTVGTDFYGNTVGDGFTMNLIDDLACNTLDFTLATHVYASYNCHISIDADSAPILTYIDTGAYVFVAATA